MKKLQIKSDIINMDLDGTLTKEVCWTPSECLKAAPNLKEIALVNKLHEKKFIIIYTARRDFLIEASLTWLRKHNVRFHAISNNKIPGYYIDDNCISIKDALR